MMKAKIEPSILRDIFDYRSDGALVWKVNTGKKHLIGTAAGWAHGPRGYQRIGLKKKHYYLHHMVWAWHYAEWPELIDHINGNPRDNRIENLRQGNQSQNMANSRGKSGRLKGVNQVQGASTWNARIMVQYRSINLGNYRTQEEAHAAYLAAAKKYFGEFARSA